MISTCYKKFKTIMKSPENLTDLQFRMINTYLLGIISIIIMLFSFILNLGHATSNIFYLVTFFIFLLTASLIGLYTNKISINIAQPTCICVLAALGYYILITDSYDASESLVWFIIFPPMILFTMGLHLGSVLATIYFLSLCVLTLTPLNFLLSDAFTHTQILRFLIAFLGAFLFSFCTEYIRYKTKSALVKAYKLNQMLAFTDPLTGLGNRRSFEDKISKLITEIKENKIPLTIMLIDIDHFKSINDTHGHDIGDLAIKHLSQILMSQKNIFDFVFRWGGEEFLLLMPKLNQAKAKVVAERIRLTTEQTTFSDIKQGTIKFTISIGYSTDENTYNIVEMIKKADQNLYKAKKNGRNCAIG